jgi:outer membrane lipoprotein-sorting protein
MLSINGSFLDNSKEFDLNFQENKSVIKIILTPKQRNMKKFINTIELIIDKKTYLATQFTLNDVSGDITTIVFENIKTNQTIEDSIFILK